MKQLSIVLFLVAVLFSSCKKNKAPICLDNPCEGLTEIEWGGHFYQLVEIGCQCWFAENLRHSIGIPEEKDVTLWSQKNTPAWCHYDNDPLNEEEYGKLYNWYAAHSPGICPPGFDIPRYEDSEELMEYLGGQFVAAGKMKTTTLWTEPNEGATNESGFSARPAGSRSVSDFHRMGDFTAYWNKDESNTTQVANNFGLEYTDATFQLRRSSKKNGLSCRCVKNRE